MLFRASDGRTAGLLSALVTPDSALDRHAVATRLVFGSLPPSTTIYPDVRVVDPGAAGSAPSRPSETPRDAARALADVLREAIVRAIGDATTVAVLAGGGVDSSALLALACEVVRARGGTIFAVALDFESPGDDRPHLRALETQLACEVVRVTPEDAATRIEHVLDGVDASPFVWPSAPMEVAALARARELGATVVLTGVGADELLDGEPRSLAEHARGGRVLEAARSARRLRGFRRPRAPFVQWVLRPLVASIVPRAVTIARARRATPAPPPPWAGPVLRDVLRKEHADAVAHGLRARDTPAARLEAARASRTNEHLRWLRHQEEVASGVRRADPYMDPEVVAHVTSLPRSWLLAGAMRRGLLREAVVGRVPESLRLRVDKASFAPALARFVEASSAVRRLAPYAGVPRLAAMGIVEPDGFARAFDAFASGAIDDQWLTWTTLATEAFLARRATANVRWLATHEEQGEVAFRIGRRDDTLVAEWIGLVRLEASRDGRDVRFVPEEGAREHLGPELEKVRRGSAALLLRHLAGKIALHGAAIAVDGRAIVLLGRSGQGKSTLAAAVCARAGASLLADDAVSVDPTDDGGYVVTPVETNHWLDRAARDAIGLEGIREDEKKRPVPAVRSASTRVPLAAFVDLAFDATSTRLERTTKLEALAALVPQVARFVLDEPEIHRREIDRLAELVERVPTYRLTRERSFERLSETAGAIATLAKETA